MVVVFVIGYIVVVHLMFKELCSGFIGKLLLLYCLAIACMAVGVATKMVMSLQTGRIQLVCHFLSFFIILDVVSFDYLATCMLHGFAYIVYRNNKLQQVFKGESKTLFRWYMAYILGTMSLSLFLKINYDLGVNQGAYIFPNGVCSSSDSLVDHTLSIVSRVNKLFQMVMFTVYLYYRYQPNKDVQNATIYLEQSRKGVAHDHYWNGCYF